MPTPRPIPRAFTVVEVVVVAAIMGILAISVVPALAGMRQAQAAEAAREVGRRVELARSTALASGHPAGVRFDPDHNTLEPLRLVGTTPQPALSALGEPMPAIRLDSLVARASLMDAGPPSPTPGADARAIWFSFDGSPQLRSPTGALVAPLSGAFRVTVAGGWLVRVNPAGAITLEGTP